MPEFIREAQWLLWVGGALVLGLLELTSLDFVFSMLVVGALSAGLAAGLGFSFTVQAFVFAGVSVIGLVVLRPSLRRWAARSAPDNPTNVDALTGRTALTLTAVDDRSGQVKLAGETWSARSADRGATIDADADVVVVRIDGATAVVRQEQTDLGDGPSPTPRPME